MGTPYDVITDRICQLLEKGVVPWRKPWTANDAANGLSRKAYRGINWLMLNSAGYSNPYWLTFKQAKECGGTVKKGERGHPCVFWRWLEVEDKEEPGEKKRIPFLRYYTVFNVEQCEGLDLARFAPPALPARDHTPIEAAEKISKGMPQRPDVRAGNQAAYHPVGDFVTMPAEETFEKAESFYAVLFHELTHATGAESRTGRLKSTMLAAFGSHEYSKEELVAEMGAAFLCHEAGISQPTIENSAAYIKSWLGRLRDDPKMIVMASAQAQKAADFILCRKPVSSEASE
jgi:antirestriction protein ArdC